MALLVQTLQGYKMMDVKIKINISDKNLDAMLPIDRVITIDESNVVYLYDTQFIINENDIEKEL